MRGMWQHLERLGGGVGTRGPGESQLESDRRTARRRITLLKRRLKDLEKQRATQRRERRRNETPTIALAGYTNVGKSTLLNALTGADVSVDDQLFHTLDPTTRGFEHEGRRYLVTDTVGFIRRLPHHLVEGFASTLEETLVADVVLHVVDASARDEEQDRQRDAVGDVLHEIGASEIPVVIVLNKIDRVDPLGRRRLSNRFPEAPHVSALTGEGLEPLKAELARRFEDRLERVRLLVPYADGGRLAELYALGAPVEEREDTPGRRARDRAPAAARAAALRAVSDRRVAFAPRDARDGQARGQEAARQRRRPGARLRRRCGDGSRRLRAGRARARRPCARADRPRCRDPGRLRGLCAATLGLAAKHGISIVNTPGLVDSGYRGELLVNLVNHDEVEPFVVEPGMRIAQLVILPVPSVELVEVDELPTSERGADGFGSSGLRWSRGSA